ncbi:MAG: dTDP-4-dehydrorhamnose reductase [Pseudomonadota bacterium]
MRILVLGARGMLGTDLVARIRLLHTVIAHTHADWDIADETACRKGIASSNADVVINCAAFTRVDDCEQNREKAFLVNGEAVRFISEACSVHGARLIQMSTDYVFNGRKNSPYRENDIPDPISVYGRSKLKGEEYASGIPDSLIVRTSWVFGKNGTNFVSTIRKLAGEKDTLRIVDDQAGSPTFTIDLASAISDLIEKKTSGIVHVTNSGVCTWYEFAKEIVRISGYSNVGLVPIKTSELDRPAPRPPYSVLDNARYAEITGDFLRPWQGALKDYLKGPEQC